MSASLSAQPELLTSSNLAQLKPVDPIRTVNSDRYSPIRGLVGHAFIRLCLWFDLLSSWKKHAYTPPAEGFMNFANSEMETEVVQQAIAS